MSLWFFLWLGLSIALLYFMGWTTYILFRQKKVWRRYASKNKLRYRSASLTSAPEMNGPREEYSVNLFTGEHITPEARSSRKLIAVEVLLSSKMPFSGGVASAGMVEVVQGLGLQEESAPKHEKWDKSYIAAAENRAAMDEYLTPERLDVLTGLMKVKNAWLIFVFKEEMTLLRFDTPDPLYSEKKLDAIINRMIKAARVLELDEGEGRRLKAVEAKKPKKQAAIKVDEDDLEVGGLELEEDEVKKEPADQPEPESEDDNAEENAADDAPSDDESSTEKS